MARIVVLGAGVVGLGAAMLLADDGHDVVVLERDATPRAGSPEEAWERWERRGVNQFRLPHYFLSRYRSIIDDELPRVARAIEAAGGLRQNPLLDAPEAVRGPARPADAACELLTGRRPVVEYAVSACADDTPRCEVRRGCTVAGLLTGTPVCAGTPHVVGVRTDDGAEVRGDLVVDMLGRRSPLPRWLEAIGASPPREELEDSGFMYFARHFRSLDGTMPFAFGGGLLDFGTISTITLAADNATWGLGIVTSASDRAMLGIKDTTRWEAVIKALPLVAHWLDGTVLDDRVVTMSKIEDRIRTFDEGGVPVATGIIAVGDAWACSNPSLGRGASIGMLHATVARDAVRAVGADDPLGLASAFWARTHDEVEPWFCWTRAHDRHRLNQVHAAIAGESYRPDDDEWEFEQCLASASTRDPDLLRIRIRGQLVIERPGDAVWTDALRSRVVELGAGWRNDEVAAPGRAELVRIAST